LKYLDEYNNQQLISGFTEKIKGLGFTQKVRLMEVCGTHTMAICRNGIKNLLPEEVELISGPGCPVCVTPAEYIDQAISLAGNDGVIISTFADLLRVPGNDSSLQKELARGADIRMVCSPLEAVQIACENPKRQVVFLAVGFETTIPVIALSIKKAAELEINNFSLLQSLKLIPPVLEELARDRALGIDGFLLPGHVSTVIGSEAFEFLSKEYNIPGVVAGFEGGDILMALYRLCYLFKNRNKRIENLYSRLVNYRGNTKALALINEIFIPVDSYWRGIGTIRDSGLILRAQYREFSAEERFQLTPLCSERDTGCICGEILKGRKKPVDCKLFSRVCTSSNPVGPCMVSQEGTCAAYFYYYQGER